MRAFFERCCALRYAARDSYAERRLRRVNHPLTPSLMPLRLPLIMPPDDAATFFMPLA